MDLHTYYTFFHILDAIIHFPPTPESPMAIIIILRLSHEVLSVYSAFHTSKPYMSSEPLTMIVIQRLIVFDG